MTLSAAGLHVERGGRPVLVDVDVDVRSGEVLALVGPNGAGKSTLLAVLAGDQAFSAGDVELDGRPLGRYSVRDAARRRAVLLQANTVSFPFTAREVVAMGRSPWAHTPRSEDDDAIVDAAMAECDVSRFADRPFTALSGGEKARVALARVLAQDTETMLLDEPTASLDLGHQETVMQIARERARTGRAVAVVLHDLGLAAAYADRIVVLSEGQVAAAGAPADVLSEELLSSVYRHPIDLVPHPRTGAPLVVPHRD
ncbi:heme ABC transporter ATP-binding protein [Rhodococcus sp. HNM0569]|uniref:heme ABC transporter ATP-binding protein n=1 Tax=Rhodococcus sp. HNM0569 TaxID=2716340 RepID=UPI003211EE0C